MIILQKLKWSNLFSYAEDNYINLNEEPIVQLVGLNGHGKSSIPLILEEVLFSKNSKGIKKGDIVNRLLDTNKYNATCEFAIDDSLYSISISRSGAVQKVKLIENGIDISSHTATATFGDIERLLDIDAKTFSQLIYQNSNSSLQFLTTTDTNRKKFLIDLLSLDRYIKIFELIKITYKEVSDLFIAAQSKEATIRSWLTTANKANLNTIGLVSVPELSTSKTDELVALKTKLSEISSINNSISINNKYIEQLNNIAYQDLTCDKKAVDTTSLIKSKTELSLKVKEYRQTITKYSGLTNSTCSTCGQEIDRHRVDHIVSEANASMNDSLSSLSSIEQEIAKANAVNTEISNHQKIVTEFEKLSLLIDKNLPTLLVDKSVLDISIKELQSYITNINDSILAATTHNNKATNHNAKVAAIKEQLTSYSDELFKVSEELLDLEDKLAILDILKKSFSTTGLIAYKIENSVKELEQLTNRYLAELSDGRFELLFELHNDKLNVVIVDNGKNVEITALSAGELCRVTTSTLLAIRNLMVKLSKNRINILFLDEVIDSLDLDGKERLIEVLLKEENLNTFLISHSYSHPLVKKLQIIKEDGISRIDYGS